MPRSSQITVPIRDRKREQVTVYAPPKAVAVTHRPLVEAGPPKQDHAHYGEMFATLEHLGVALTTSPRGGAIDPVTDVVNRWVTLSYPASAFPSHAEAVAFSGEMRLRAEDATPVEYAYSRRRLPGQGMPLGANAITSGYNLVLQLERRAEEGTSGRVQDLYGIQHGAAWIDPMRSAAEVLADWDALEELFTDEDDHTVHEAWLAKRRELELRLLERFEPYSARVAQTDLTFRATRALPGLHCPSFIGYEQFHNWYPEDTVNYRSERLVGGRRERGVPWLTRAPGTSTRMRCQLVPRRHRIIAAMTAIYAVSILFTSPFYVAEPILFTYADILPLDWAYPFSVDDPRNEEVMSRRIADSPAYHQAVRQARGAEVFSPFYVKVLIGFDDAQWAARTGDRQRGELTAILDISNAPREGEEPVRYEITRETHVEGGELMNRGAFFTNGVFGHSKGESRWSNSVPWGGL